MVAPLMIPTETLKKSTGPSLGPQGSHMLYASNDITVSALTAGAVRVDVSLDIASGDENELRALLKDVAPAKARLRTKKGRNETPGFVREAIKAAFITVFSRRFSSEIDEVVEAYRVMLRESLAKGDDSELRSALNRARLQEKILANTRMVDQAQACELLGLSGTNPSATMRRKEEKREILRFTVDGRAAYPLFQFDVEGRRIFPVLTKLIALKPKTWSDFRLLHWLTRPHLDFGTIPAERLSAEEEKVVAAFEREIVPAEHG